MIHVSMGIIFKMDSKVLIAQRPHNKNYGGLWEFPGGKLENSETPAEALIRELKEELNIIVEAESELAPYTFSDLKMEFTFYPIICRIAQGKIKNHEHPEIRYVDKEEIDKFEFAPPDVSVVEQLKLIL
jgi:8-oxo-dGTP diphosphatase